MMKSFPTWKGQGGTWQWNTTNWSFQECLNNTLGNSTIKCKKISTIVLGQKNIAWSLVRRKQVSTSAENVRCCCFSAPVFTCFRLTKGLAAYLRPEKVVASFLHFMVLLPKTLFNQENFVLIMMHKGLIVKFVCNLIKVRIQRRTENPDTLRSMRGNTYKLPFNRFILH